MKLWSIVKGFISFIAFASIVTAGVVYYLSTKETSNTLNEKVVPQLEYLVKADSANRARDAIMQCKVDSTRLIVDALAKKRVVEIVNDPSLTRGEFLQEMKPLMEYLDDVKKNERSKQFEPLSKWDTDIPFLEELGILPESLIPSTDLLPMNRK